AAAVASIVARACMLAQKIAKKISKLLDKLTYVLKDFDGLASAVKTVEKMSKVSEKFADKIDTIGIVKAFKETIPLEAFIPALSHLPSQELFSTAQGIAVSTAMSIAEEIEGNLGDYLHALSDSEKDQ
ncbi:MAG: hypothetical protein ACRCSF_11605, partial [Mycobacteriaceae bacterium]